MPKPSTNQLIKAGTKQDRRRERREEQLRQAAAQRRATRLRWIVVGVIIVAAVLTVASFLYFTHGSSTATTATQAAPTATSASTPVNTAAQQSLSPAVDNVQCNSSEQLTYHVHAHLSLYINGKAVPVSQYVGITNACFYWLHTHDTSGVIHIEAPQQTTFTLGNFLHLWKQQFSQLQYPTQLDNASGWQAYVDGKPYSGDFNAIPLNPHALITLAYHSPGVKPDTIYNWNGL
ncbi:MAG: hypothetical protein M3Y39_09390 [Chloroflexota bacterium]|nr:hypothetical protein [Chloroflexota bacterium]